MHSVLQCHDCGVDPGALHENGCAVERCPACGRQALSCPCAGSSLERLPWTGVWPGSAECAEMDLWCRWSDVGWLPCSADHPAARHDLNRLSEVAHWDVTKRAWVRN